MGIASWQKPGKIKIKIERKPPPPPLPSFVCAVCENHIERDPYHPEFEKPPICFECAMHVPTRPQLAHVGVERWNEFYRVHALICAINQEVKRAKFS
jgi:hypothetical protein